MKKVWITVISCLSAAAVAAGGLAAWFIVPRQKFTSAPRDANTLWYQKPAANDYDGWEQEALPIGNGYMGAKIFGGVKKERIQFNEKTLWSGGPEIEGYNGGNSRDDSGAALREIQQLLAQENYDAAQEAMTKLQGNETGRGSYQNFGDLYLKFQGVMRGNNYIRDLNLNTAVSSVSFTSGGVDYRREYFASYPDRVIAARLTASEGGHLSFDAVLESAQNGTVSAADNTITLTGTVMGKEGKKGATPDANSMRYAAQVRVIPDGGTITANGDGSLTVSEADSVTILLTAATDYANDYPEYRSGVDPMETVREKMEAATALGYDQLYQRHETDYTALFDRVQLDLGQQGSLEPTDRVLKDYQKDGLNPSLEALYFQYGRYLLIASSREGSLPANLQGVWNGKNDPMWESDYHTNINLQMNYWPAYVTNLSETALPLLEYVESLREPGRKTANMYTGIGADLPDGTPDTSQATGWMVHTQNTPLGMTGPGSVWTWGWSPTAGAWLTQNTFDYFAFTQDVDMLREEIYPAMQESALMWSQLLIEDPVTGRLISSPSYSPEHGPVAAGNTYDQSIIWQLYSDTIKAADALTQAGFGSDVDASLIETLKAQINRLDPVQVGAWGQVKEWPQEDTWEDRGFKTHDVEKEHRHMSNLLGLYPGNYITLATPEYLDAARVTLEDRGDGGTGWSKAQKICEWARLLDGNHSYKMLSELLKESTLDNLWDTHPPFQIDGNFGATAGIAEMLIQSHAGYIQLLPALPDAWAKSGSVFGLVARGNFVFDFSWADGKLSQVRMTARSGGDCKMYCPADSTLTVTDANGQPVAVERVDDLSVRFASGAGESYTIAYSK
ncbi:MAG: glycosyl hydrolase family 95 catalytic domain-containing protein [Clostridia bacterium]